MRLGQNANPLPRLSSCPSEKYFTVVREDGVCPNKKFDILFEKENMLGFWKKVGKKFSIDKERLVLNYPVKISGEDGGIEYHTVTWDEDIEDTLKLFYKLGHELDTVKVSCGKKVVRKKRPVEKEVKILKGHAIVNKQYYLKITQAIADF